MATVLDGAGNAVHVSPDTRIVPVFAAIPMGWTHSLAVCQAVLEGLACKVAGVSAEVAHVDRKVAPMIDPMIHTEYAGNFESYAYREHLVAEAAKGVEGLLNDALLPTDDVFVTKGGASLGWEFSAVEPILGVSVRGMWRLRLGLLEFARRGFGSGHQLEILVGHFTSRALLRRELLAVFGSAYTFIAKHRRHHLKLAVGEARIDMGSPPDTSITPVPRGRMDSYSPLLRCILVGIRNRQEARSDGSSAGRSQTL